jgi:hypothetical protein
MFARLSRTGHGSSLGDTFARCGRWFEVATTNGADWIEEVGLGKIIAEKSS